MNVYAWVLLVVLAVLAVASWSTGARDPRRRPSLTERAVRPAYVLVLAALAWLLHADQTPVGAWLLLGLAFTLVAAVLVGTASDVAFGFGMLATLSARLAYLGAFWLGTGGGRRWAGVAGTVLVSVLVVLLVLRPLARRSTAEAVGPSVYVLVLAALVGVAWWDGPVVAATGASALALGDGLAAAVRFGRDVVVARVLAVVAGQLGSLFVVAGLLRPDLGPG